MRELLDAEIVESRHRGRGLARSHAWSSARVRQVYNEEGFLKAEVVGQPLTIDGTTGVLVIDDQGGPARADHRREVGRRRRATVARVAEGRGDQPAGAVRRRRGERRAAADRGSSIASRASTARQVEVQPTIDADDTVVLTFDVVEGPQQVLQDVELAGLEVTNRQGRDPGAPVRAGQAGRSRRMGAGPQAALRHQRLPSRRHPAGAGRRSRQRRAAGQGGRDGRGVSRLVGALRLPARGRAAGRAR